MRKELIVVSAVACLIVIVMWAALQGKPKVIEDPILQFVSGTEYVGGETGQVIVEARYGNGTSAFLAAVVIGGGNNTSIVYGPYQQWPGAGFNTSQLLTSDVANVNPYANAFDGNYGGSWWQVNTPPAGQPAWVIVQLQNQSAFHVDMMGVYFYDSSYNADQFQIYGGDDLTADANNGTWVYLGQQLFDNAFSNVSLSNNATKYKRYLINMTVVTPPAYPAIFEITPFGYASIDIVYGNVSNVTVNGTACNISIWYPNRTIFIDEMNASEAPSGNQYIDFIVPDVEGVYEYQAKCKMKGNKQGIISKSFHVVVEEIRAVMPK